MTLSSSSINGYDLHVKIHESKGMQFLDRMRAHSFSYNIFSMNYYELKEALKIIENPEVSLHLFAVENREKNDQAHREINRLFHNFLASAQTLVEHTRIFMRTHYLDTSVLELYDKKIKSDFSANGLCKFIQDLRNFMLHRGLPHSQMTLSGSSDGDIETSISLDIVKLKSWSKWSSQSKRFLSDIETIRICELVEEYGEKIDELYSWLNERLQSYHESDVSELEAMQGEYNAKYGATK